MTTLLYTFAVVGVLHVLLDLSAGVFLWWYFRKSAAEREEVDIGVEKTEKRPYAG